MDVPVRRALISAWRKEGIPSFGSFLQARGVEILSTGGTARCLREAGVTVVDVSEVTGFPEMMDGRVKTLHPRVHGGLLFRRDVEEHVRAASEHGIPRIDLLVVDLYPFEEAVAQPGARREACVEMMDIGGPAMIRAAAKNHAHVCVVTDPADLETVEQEMARLDGAVSEESRVRLAAKAFARTAAYDAAIAAWMADEKLPERLVLGYERKAVTRYGENPHQQGAVYLGPKTPEASLARAEQLSGKELSYNNYLDASAAWELVRGFALPAAAVIKHRNPCGAAIDAEDLGAAFDAASEGDPLSAFGGILALNRDVTADLARRIASPDRFLEVIIAPGFDAGAVEALKAGAKWGRNVRILATGGLTAPPEGELEIRSISGGLLVQERDPGGAPELSCVTRREPSERELSDLKFAWEVCRYVTSNAIVLAREGRMVGCGAGQMSRVDAVELATRKAQDRAQGAVMASDAFFPFPDGIQAAARAGTTAVIQPGGSIRDDAVVAACDEAGLAMLLTGRRHFRH